MNKYWRITISSFVTLAAILTIVQIKYHPLSSHTTITHFSSSADESLADYYQTGQQSANQNNQGTTTATFLAVGDINLSRDVAATIQEQNNIAYPFLGMASILKSTDFNFANLESPIAPGQPVIGGTGMTFGAPPLDATALKDYNFQILNLANNHAFDQGLAGIQKTIATLNNLGIAHEGSGNNLTEAWTPAVVEANGIKICFVGATYGTNSGGTTAAQYVAEIADVTNLKTAINKAKAECDFVVVTMHAGIEYTAMPNQQQITFAHTAIDDGADIVIGAHPHWIQPIEQYKGNYIFYSLGNFIFDQSWSQDTSEGLTLKMTISKAGCHPEGVQPTEGSLNVSTSSNLSDSSAALGMANTMTCDGSLQGSRQGATLDSIELLPIIITNSQPRPATADETKKILLKIGRNQNILLP